MIEILVGDCRETLKTLPDQSVNTCITSPPYWGLRDYGTAEWEGGDPNCDHIQPHQKRGENSKKQSTNNKGQAGTKSKICKKCGAVRKDKQLGLEDTPEEFVDNLVQVFREVKRVLRDDGTVWLNLGDSYAGPKGNNRGEGAGGGQKRGELMGFNNIKTKVPKELKQKDLVGIPWRVAFALQQDGWYLRQDIIWHKPNPMPESVTDRCTKAHEYIFLLSKQAKYYYDHEAIREDCEGVDEKQWAEDYEAVGSVLQGESNAEIKRTKRYNKDGSFKRNKRSVWTVTTKPYKEAHFATFPMDLIKPCVLAGCPEGGTVLDPFGGSGTTGQVADAQNRNAILCELNSEYIKISKKRLGVGTDLFSDVKIKND